MEIMKEKLKQQKMRNRSHLLTGEGSLGTEPRHHGLTAWGWA